jgi:predicted enzyme related to lactoylglutathione lyase
MVLLALAAVALAGCEATPGEQPDLNITRPVSPVSSLPTESWRPGMVVWADLVTPDLAEAIEFYSAVFGWGFVVSEDEDYAEASYHGRLVGSFVLYRDDEAGRDDGRWLISISVQDVDAAAAAAAARGGKILVPPEDLPNRGRYTLIRDAEGALCMLLHATGGDPREEAPSVNRWMWAELFSHRPEQAAAFYESVVGYRSGMLVDRDGASHRVLGKGGKARASVVELPWEGVDPSWVPGLLVSDVIETLRKVQEHGGSVVFAAGADPAYAIVADPGGGVFSVQEREAD